MLTGSNFLGYKKNHGSPSVAQSICRFLQLASIRVEAGQDTVRDWAKEDSRITLFQISTILSAIQFCQNKVK